MKRHIVTLLFCTMSLTGYAQFVARMELKEPIPGLCDPEGVYALIPGLKGQVPAECPQSRDAILERLNNEVPYLKDHPGCNDQGMIGVIVSCKGEVLQSRMDNLTKDPALDAQIEEVFRTLGEWKPGKLNRKAVDSSSLFSFYIRNGRFTFDKD